MEDDSELIGSFILKETSTPAQHVRVRVAGFGVLIAAAACWIGLRGADLRNLSPALALWIGALAAVGLIVGKRRKFLLTIASLFLFLGIVETTTLAYEEFVKAPAKKYSYEANVAPGWMAEHRLVGYAFRGPVELLATATIGKDVIYERVPYKIDVHSRRLCAATQHPTRHALFFGGSFAFGEGLSNDQTLGCQFQKMSGGEYESTTYAMMGWGAAQAVIELGVDSLFVDIKEPSGIAVFAFIDDHVYRTTWKIDTASDFADYPFFTSKENGALEGPFRASDRWPLGLKGVFFGFLRKVSPTFRNLVKPSWFRTTSDVQAVITTARVLGAARKLYRARFDGEFIVLLWPRSRLDPLLEGLFVNELANLEVPVFLAPALPGDTERAKLHPKDGHPSSEETTWVARALYEEVLTKDW